MVSTFALRSFFASVALVSGCATEEDLGRRSTKPDGGSSTSDDPTPSGSVTNVAAGSASPVCEGAPLPCNSTPDETTCTKRGCAYAPKTCTGKAFACATYSQIACMNVPGCTWRQVSGNSACTGQAVACDERPPTRNVCEPAFTPNSGCRVEGACSGTPKPCSDDPGPTCSPGCSPSPR